MVKILFLNKFLKDNRGVGIIEFIIILSLIGTVTVVVTPTIRESVGKMYEEQIKSTDNHNGTVNSDGTTEAGKRIDISDGSGDSSGSNNINKGPNTSIGNTNDFKTTEPTTPSEFNPDKKIVEQSITNTTGKFSDSIIYNKDNYKGTLTKSGSPVKNPNPVDVDTKIVNKTVSDTVTVSDKEKFPDSVEYKDKEGYVGTLYPSGKVTSTLNPNKNGTSTLTKNSGNVYITKESFLTVDPSIKFDSTLDYEEVTEQGETGYSGVLKKTGSPEVTLAGTKETTEEKEVTQTFKSTKKYSLSGLGETKTQKVTKGTIGTSPTNNESYDSKLFYKSGTIEGWLQLKNRIAEKTNPLIEKKTITEERTNSEKSKLPTSITYNKDGYEGVLTQKGKATVVSGTPADSKEITGVSRGDNTAAAINYKLGAYTGTLYRYHYSGAYYPADKKYVTNQPSANYNSNGYVGTLTKYVASGDYTPADKKYVTNQPSANYNSNGYVGTLTKYVASGNYTPADKKYVTNQPSANYNSGGYVGTLTKYLASGKYTSEHTKYVTGQSSANYNSGGYVGKLTKYVASGTYTPEKTKHIKENTYRVFREEYYTYYGNGKWSDGPTRINPTLESSPRTKQYSDKDGYVGVLNRKYVGIENQVKVDAPGTLVAGKEYIRNKFYSVYYFEGDVIKPASDTRVYKYQGNVTKPASDTRVYKYQGNVTKPASDTRVYKYQGNVTKPALDTREYRYKGTISIPDTRVWGKTYSGQVTKTTNQYKYSANYEGLVYDSIKILNKFTSDLTKERSHTDSQGYSGTLTKVDASKKSVIDKITYNNGNNTVSITHSANYKGKLSKVVTKNYYEHKQAYSGVITRTLPSFSYNHHKEYSGVVTKNDETYIYEYTQKYKGEVTEY